ncbi:MAG: SUMF1/EgtB/PvdO family nonheme iron enzyme [bacterium]|jgi:hypothetical protein|nr:SUMF1/EgtB/PvdO family nonheme iron enzyme [bacterium]
MRNFVILSLLLLSISCNSGNSALDTDNFSDDDVSDYDEAVEEEEDVYNNDVDELTDEETDEIPDIVYPEPTCIEIYEGDPKSKLCFGPVKTKVKCNGFPKDGEYTIILNEDNPIGNPSKPMDINDDFVFFPINPKDKSYCFGENTYCPSIYACSRFNGYLYEIIMSKFIHNVFSVYSEKILFVLSDQANIRNKLFLGDLVTNEVKSLSGWGDGGYGGFNFKNSFLTYASYDSPYIFNLETNETAELNWLKGPFPRNDGKHLVLTGYYKQPGEGDDDTPFGSAAWIVDMETLETKPLNVTASFAEGVVNIEGDYVFIGSGRDTVYYEDYPMQYSGMDIYTFNLKTKREEKMTPEIKGIFEGNSIRPSFEYPYFHYISNEDDYLYSGGSFVLNIETGEIIPFLKKSGDVWFHIKDRHILVDASYTPYIGKLPDIPNVPQDDKCNDNNICTDDRYFVTDGQCHFIPNHERCDDNDVDTLLDVCVEGICQGYSGTGTDEGMVYVTAGSFIYDGLEFWIKKPFMMDVFEVTNSDYEKCVESKACVPPLKNRSLTVIDYYGNPLYDNYPVLYINQYEAQIYCNWLGKRLPTEFEWMKAAWDGTEKTYLWGEEEPYYETYPASFYANTGVGYPGFVGFDTVEVGTFPVDKTVSGIMDMSGNVSEWTTSEWTYDLCVEPPCEGYFGSDLVVAKGGGYLTGPELKTRHPYTPWTHSFFTGFRCVKDVGIKPTDLPENRCVQNGLLLLANH